jgi:hypothetical protein
MPFYEFQCAEGTVTERLVPMGTAQMQPAGQEDFIGLLF